MQNKFRLNVLPNLRSSTMALVIGVLIILFLTNRANCVDYSDLNDKLDIRWDLTPNDILRKYEPVESIFWFGRIEDTSVTAIPSGKVEVLWFFSHHAFINPGRNAVNEPFHVEKQNSGYF